MLLIILCSLKMLKINWEFMFFRQEVGGYFTFESALTGMTNLKNISTGYAAGPAYYVLHPQKGITICLFFNLPGLQKPGRSHFPKNSYWGITEIGILVSQNNLWTTSLIRVQGDCACILFSSFSKSF